jgi:phosphoglycerate kinase
LIRLLKLSQVNFEGKRVFLRVDINVPIYNGKIEDYSRIIRLKPTIDFLKKGGAKIILASHLGRPNGCYNPMLSTNLLIRDLEKIYETKVLFFDIASPENSHKINKGEILLLENLRFDKREESNDSSFARELASYADIYVNDAFSCSHRVHTSIVGVAKLLPAYPGLLMEQELDSLNAILDRNNKPITAIVAGKKISTKFHILENLVKFVDHLIIGGAMANTFLKAIGYAVGKSFYEPDFLTQAHDLIFRYKSKIILPSDAVCAEEGNKEFYNITAKDIDKIFDEQIILDVGPDTVSSFSNIIRNSKMLLWNGPLGFYEDGRFATSTAFIAQVIAKQTAAGRLISVAGGGDVVAALAATGLSNEFSYLSTAGGAFLEWLEGEELPGLSCLPRIINCKL